MEIDKAEALRLVEGLDGSDELKVSFVKSQLESARIDAELKADERKELIKMRGRWSQNVLRLLIFIIISDTLFITL